MECCQLNLESWLIEAILFARERSASDNQGKNRKYNRFDSGPGRLGEW